MRSLNGSFPKDSAVFVRGSLRLAVFCGLLSGAFAQARTPAPNSPAIEAQGRAMLGKLSLTLDARSFSYWDAAAHKWTIDPGKFIVRVGDSSENTPLEANLMMK